MGGSLLNPIGRATLRLALCWSVLVGLLTVAWSSPSPCSLRCSWGLVFFLSTSQFSVVLCP